MALAKYRTVGDKIGSGRFVVSEGVAPSTYLLPHENLPTLEFDSEDDRFEIVIMKGTILSVVADANGYSRLVPCNGTETAQTYDDGSGNEVEVGTTGVGGATTPIGCAQYNLYRPFDRGTSQGGGWITHGYVEWPLVDGLNDDLAPGDPVTSDAIGRPVKADPDVAARLLVGKVAEIERFGTTYDDGLLRYMQLPGDAEHMLNDLFSITSAGPHQGLLGVRVNLDKPNAVGAVRVTLTI